MVTLAQMVMEDCTGYYQPTWPKVGMSQVIASHTCHGVYNGLCSGSHRRPVRTKFSPCHRWWLQLDCSSQDICVVSSAVLRGLNGHELLASLGIIHLWWQGSFAFIFPALLLADSVSWWDNETWVKRRVDADDCFNRLISYFSTWTTWSPLRATIRTRQTTWNLALQYFTEKYHQNEQFTMTDRREDLSRPKDLKWKVKLLIRNPVGIRLGDTTVDIYKSTRRNPLTRDCQWWPPAIG